MNGSARKIQARPLSVFRHRLTKTDGFAGPKSFQGFQESGLRTDIIFCLPNAYSIVSSLSFIYLFIYFVAATWVVMTFESVTYRRK